MGEASEQFLEHVGVKGMKWGVRKDRGHEGERAKTKQINKLDQKFERKTQSMSTWIDLHNSAARRSNEFDIDRINNKAVYKDMDFNRESPLRRKYMAEHEAAYLKNLDKAAADMGTNASGTKKYAISTDADGNWGVYLSDVKHAEGLVEEPNFTVKLSFDKLGHIVKLEVVELIHGLDLASNFLAHYGVKGMRWGKRKSAPDDEPASKDHEKSRELIKRSTKSLSNEEIQTINTRLQLERSYGELASQKSVIQKGNKKAKDYLAVANTAQSIYTFANSPMVKQGLSLAKDLLR